MRKTNLDDCTGTIRVFYDAACPVCQKDRRWYDSQNSQQKIEWCDINTETKELSKSQIDPQRALLELHIQTPEGKVIKSIEAYVVLLNNIPWARPLAWLLNLYPIKILARAVYDAWVKRRLQQQDRYPY